MTDMNTFAVIGGDLRQAYLAEAIAADGYFVYASEFDKYPFSGMVKKTSTEEAVERCTHVILPLPVTIDGITINAPYAYQPVILDEYFASLLGQKPVFGGQMDKLPKMEIWYQVRKYDYFQREALAVENAVPSAEGALEIAMRELPVTINGCRCLVAGYGRIGKVLARMLQALGAKVTVSARKPEDLAWIRLAGFRSVSTAEIRDSGRYDVIFNTIPAVIFDAQTLSLAAEGALVIDLASAPYGVDFEAAKRLNIKTILATGLPGKVAPQTAGIIIKNAVFARL